MTTLDAIDIKYRLSRLGYRLNDVARELDVTPQTVNSVIWGRKRSRRVVMKIEELLGMGKGELGITPERPQVHVAGS